MKTIKVVDSHTGGEPTRIIVSGGPDLGTGTMPERVELLDREFDQIRTAVVTEPRGSDVIVGGIICQPTDPSYLTGIIYFNNAGYLGMCGHGTIGLMVTLKHMGRVQDGTHKLETPVGPVIAKISGNSVAVQNVDSYRYRKDVAVEVPDYGTVVGDIAWGGNWFFLVKRTDETLTHKNVRRLTEVTMRIRGALDDQQITGADGGIIDHIELFCDPDHSENNSKNFVLCPGGAYDRSPCGTGTSAKMACLAADGRLEPGQSWRQESIVGSVFTGSYQYSEAHDSSDSDSRRIIPTIEGEAYVTGEATLILDPSDPFCTGIPS